MHGENGEDEFFRPKRSAITGSYLFRDITTDVIAASSASLTTFSHRQANRALLLPPLSGNHYTPRAHKRPSGTDLELPITSMRWSVEL